MLMRVGLFVVAAGLFLLQGCVAVQTFPGVARAGDTITLALGSVDGLDKTKLQISFVPQSTGIPVDLTANIRSVLKIYPDRTSRASLGFDYTYFLTGFSGHAAWMNIAILDLPASLPIGQGYFQVVYADSVKEPNTAVVQSAEGVQIGMEILPGTGSANSFSYHANTGNIQAGNFTVLEPLPHVVLRHRTTTNYNSSLYPAAAEFRIRLPVTGDITTLEDTEISVIWEHKPDEDNKQIQLSWRRQGDEITVNVLVPTDLRINNMHYRFSIVIDPLVNGHVIDVAGIPQLLSTRYFDLSGNLITSQYSTPEVVVMK